MWKFIFVDTLSFSLPIGKQENIMSFTQSRKMKLQVWFSKVNNAKKYHKRDTEVSINIGIPKWSDKQLYLKPVRGKRVAIKVKTNESYSNLLQKAISKFSTFYKVLLHTECQYVLTFENGHVANIIPGTAERFTLTKYKEKIAKF